MRSSFLLKSLTANALLGAATLGTGYAQQLRTVGSFEMLQASGSCDVVLTQGAATTVKVVTDAGLERYIRTEVQNGTLVVSRTPDAPAGVFNNKQVTVYVTCPRLLGVRASGASDVKSTSTFEAESFTIEASGSSDVTLGLNTGLLKVTASGSSDVELQGRAERQQIRLSGSSDYQATNLQSQQADVQASGSSDAYVAAEKLTSHASGSSDIYNKARTRR